MKLLTVPVLFFTAAVCMQGYAVAGGPLYSFNGRAVVYPPSLFPVPFSIDRGALGTMSNEEAAALVEGCFQVWQNVQTASITFHNAGHLPVDVDASHMGEYDSFSDGINPVIFDSDGSIIDLEFGEGAREDVLGFAVSRYTGEGYYTEGMAVLNGVPASELSPGEFTATIVHELGHFLGLDHCQINTSFVQDGDTENDRYVPTMFPLATDNDTSLGDLNPDDEAALTLLYPGGSADAFYAGIQGTVRREDGSPVLGANVVAVNSADEQMARFSSVSDYYRQKTGAYEMLVSPGTYRLFIEPIDERFTGASRIGPYADHAGDLSFINPVSVQYYSDTLTVAAGETLSGIDFIVPDDPVSTTTTTIAADTCPPDKPVDCGNGLCCPVDLPRCGENADGEPACLPEDVVCPVVMLLGNDSAATNLLRRFRDDILLCTETGTAVVKLYDQYKKELADVVMSCPAVRGSVTDVLSALLPVMHMILGDDEC